MYTGCAKRPLFESLFNRGSFISYEPNADIRRRFAAIKLVKENSSTRTGWRVVRASNVAFLFLEKITKLCILLHESFIDLRVESIYIFDKIFNIQLLIFITVSFIIFSHRSKSFRRNPFFFINSYSVSWNDQIFIRRARVQWRCPRRQ